MGRETREWMVSGWIWLKIEGKFRRLFKMGDDLRLGIFLDYEMVQD
jgi:hypothetical protein